ncbi:LAGLIDADG family homing endonuclease [Candidatus Kaiserbacteria bacterium]|nr:LAGLIDADG family homing endonuclease [Candidatus Kaiserbacteria bacterium]
MKKIDDIPPYIGWYIAGFVDGEGSFNVSFRKRHDHTIGWQTVLTLNVAQRDKTVLALMKQHLGCGRLQARRDGVWYYVVANPASIEERIIPFFERFGFLSAKSKRNFMLFREIAHLVFKKKHLTRSGLEEIAQIRELLNEGRGRTRKYTIDHIMADSDGNPQRLYVERDTNRDDRVRPHGRP